MVAVYEFDDIEFRSLDWARRVVGHRDGSGDTGVESVEEEAVFVYRRVYSSASVAGRVLVFCAQ